MTAQTTAALGAPQFTIGKVLGTSLSILFRNIVPFGIIATVITVPYILLLLASGFDQAQLVVRQTHELPPGFMTDFVLVTLVFAATSSLISAALVYGTFQDLRGQRATIGEALGRGLSALFPVILASFVYSIFLFIGFVLLIVPGIIVMVTLWVYVPAIIMERAGVSAAFTRSRELTKGRRWSIFGIFLILLVAGWLLGMIVDFAFLVKLGTNGAIYVNWALQVIMSAYSAVVIAVGYYYLRADKEGIAIGDIAKVFD